MIKKIVQILRENTFVEDEDQLKKEIEEAIKENRFKILYDRQNKPQGFFTFLKIEKEGLAHIYLGNGFIKKEARGKINIYEVRNFFRKTYPNLGLIYWHRNKKTKEKFYYKKG